MGSRTATQQSTITTRTNCSQVARLDARGPVSHSVDATMDPKQRASAHALLDLLRGDPGAHELRTRDDSV
jgi:hypothetical protein